MINFILYSVEYPQGKVLASVSDEAHVFLLSGYYKRTYTHERFLITIKRPRQKQQWVVGHYLHTKKGVTQ
jgi:hypothetical protein